MLKCSVLTNATNPENNLSLGLTHYAVFREEYKEYSTDSSNLDCIWSIVIIQLYLCNKALLETLIFTYEGRFSIFNGGPKIHYHIHSSSSLDSIRSQINPFRTITSYVLAYFNTIFSCASKASKWFLSGF